MPPLSQRVESPAPWLRLLLLLLSPQRRCRWLALLATRRQRGLLPTRRLLNRTMTTLPPPPYVSRLPLMIPLTLMCRLLPQFVTAVPPAVPTPALIGALPAG